MLTFVKSSGGSMDSETFQNILKCKYVMEDRFQPQQQQKHIST